MIGAQQHESREKKKRREIGTLGILRTCLFLETPGLCRKQSQCFAAHFTASSHHLDNLPINLIVRTKALTGGPHQRQ